MSGKEKGAGSFAFDIIKEHIKDSKARIVDLEYPMHYHGDELKKMWQENGRIISEYLKGEKTGAFITLGDPSVYSTFMYTLPYIEAFGTEIEVIPGIPVPFVQQQLFPERLLQPGTRTCLWHRYGKTAQKT